MGARAGSLHLMSIPVWGAYPLNYNSTEDAPRRGPVLLGPCNKHWTTGQQDKSFTFAPAAFVTLIRVKRAGPADATYPSGLFTLRWGLPSGRRPIHACFRSAELVNPPMTGIAGRGAAAACSLNPGYMMQTPLVTGRHEAPASSLDRDGTTHCVRDRASMGSPCRCARGCLALMLVRPFELYPYSKTTT